MKHGLRCISRDVGCGWNKLVVRLFEEGTTIDDSRVWLTRATAHVSLHGNYLHRRSASILLDKLTRPTDKPGAMQTRKPAMEWAKSVQEEKGRAQGVEQIFQQWRIKDAAAAEAALASAGLPREKVQQLMKSPPTVKAAPR